MTIKTWMAEYYPISAKSFIESSDEECIMHSLKKFEGAKKENLKKHNVVLYEGDIYTSFHDDNFANSIPSFSFDSFTCALCQKYCLEELSCKNCPLYRIEKWCNVDIGPWDLFLKGGNPIPMIKALEEALEI